MTPEDRRARAYAAKALIDDQTIQEGWTEIENDIRAVWERTTGRTPWATRKREALHTELQLLRRLRGKLASFAGQARD